MNRKARVIVVLGILTLIVAIGAMSMRGDRRGGVEVRIERVEERDLTATVTANGWIRPRRSVDIQADLMGRVTDLRVREGDSVRVGQILLQIDDTEYRAAVSRARAGVAEASARLAQARAGLLQAERGLERTRKISDRDSTLVSPQTLEDAVTQAAVQKALVEAAQHGVEQAAAALSEAENRLAKTTIRAPLAGTVTRLNVETGETAIVGTMNNPGSLLLTISDLSGMEAVVHVDETDLPSISLGDSATIEIDAFTRQRFTGTVTEIAHSSVVQRNNLGASGSSSQQQAIDFEVVISIATPPSLLRPDLSATARIVTDRRAGVPSIPIIALTVRDRPASEPVPDESARAAEVVDGFGKDQEGVFIVRGGKARFVPVEVGITGAEHFEVLSGVTIGDSVVAGPYEAIRALDDGGAVRGAPTGSARGAGERTREGEPVR